MPAPSLLQLARKACIKIIKRIEDIGLARYDLIRPILLKIENPEQLHELELKSPHLLEYDAELWIEFIKRDVPRFNELVLPKNPDSWYDVYHELLEKTAREVDEDAERMRLALLGLDSKKAKHGSKVVDTRKMQLPKEKPTAIQKYAFLDRKMGGIAPVFVPAAKPSGGRGLTPYNQAPRWKFETPKLPRQAPKKSGLPFVKRNTKLCIPTHRLNNNASQVVRAPRSLVEDYKRPPEPKISKQDGRATQAGTTPTRTSTRTGTVDSKSSNQHSLPSPAPSPHHSIIAKSSPPVAGRYKTSAASPPPIGPYASPPEESHSSNAKPLPNIPKFNLDDQKPANPPRPPVRKRPAPESALIMPKKRRAV
ncbi:hypothetical protein FQN55_006562 [Onygenales sp. PD_40]|nr:hypothetical protein FQN55_006562 [Onygenales sp. PD_40]KAK2759726.1 hypothetical protein FQN53_008011 [Emmonsiellopsis sp. PD_33]KAK2782726.1 hypothetical protein FQN52_000756 [Onygenales sp. PD_12]KAK2803918.1 hypothetical protein FQN51_002804 [Onygenales sp. PD_10]